MKKISNNKIITIERRYNILIAITIIAMLILVIGLFNVQILKHNYYKDKLQELTKEVIKDNEGRIDSTEITTLDNNDKKIIKQFEKTYKHHIEVIDINMSGICEKCLEKKGL